MTKFLVVLFCAAVACGREPVWVLNHGTDVDRVRIGQGTLHREVGLTRVIPTGTDLTMVLVMSREDEFLAGERPFFALRYKYRTAVKQAGLFFTTDSLAELSDKSYSPFAVIGDNTWRTAVIDMRTFSHNRWDGMITAVRLDPINPSDTGSLCEISRLGFFPSDEQARRFLDAAVDAPDYAQPTRFLSPFQSVLVPGGCLSDGFDRADFMLRETAVAKPSVATVVQFKPKDAAGEAQVVALSQTNSRGFTWFVARQPGVYGLVNRDVLLDDISQLDEGEQTAAAFVAARNLLGAVNARAFRPDASVDAAEWRHALDLLGEYGLELSRRAVPVSRIEAAVVLKAAVQNALGTAIDSPYDRGYFTRERIRIGAWVTPQPEAIDADFIATYRAAGFDWILADGALLHSDYRGILLRECDRHGIELILGDGGYQKAAEATAEYFDHPCFAGTYISDEPGTEQYGELAEICAAYIRDTGGKLPYINLLPMYANAAQLKFGAHAAAIEYYDPDPDLYRKYCDQFCRMFDVPYLCTDIYPLNWTQGRRTTYKNYCESINVAASSAREHGKEFWCFIQTFAWTAGKRTPTESEFRWQSYCMLSFGCRALLCWTYAGSKPEFPSLIALDGLRSNAWYDAAAVFKEIRLISDAFVRYRSLGAMSHNCTEKTPYLKFSHPVETFAVIERIECEQPLLIGCFDAKQGEGRALTLVNMSELEAVETVQVKMRLAGSKVIAWPRGQRVELKAGSDGLYAFALASGEGVFVEVEP